jgi:integrase
MPLSGGLEWRWGPRCLQREADERTAVNTLAAAVASPLVSPAKISDTDPQLAAATRLARWVGLAVTAEDFSNIRLGLWAFILNCGGLVLAAALRRRPWTEDGFGSSFNKAKMDARLVGRDLHFHDLRGTAATKFYVAGFSMREIAETMGWEEEHVEKIIRRYVGRSVAIKAMIQKLRRSKE